MTSELDQAIKAAHTAGRQIMAIYRSEYSVEEKSDRSPVTAADTASQHSIFQDLNEFGYGFLGEAGEEQTLTAGRSWIVDPLDGTKDFIEKTDEFAVMIGLVENGEVSLGVVYLPALELTYFAERGGGAYKQEAAKPAQLIQVSQTATLREARAPTSRFHLDEATRRFLERAGITQTATVGSLGYKLCTLAEGRMDLYVTTTDRTWLWDICAGEIILQEAGGELVDLRGEPFVYQNDKLRNKHGLVACNRELTAELFSVLEEMRE